MHDMNTFQALVDSWSKLSDDPKTLNEDFMPLRNIYQAYLTDKEKNKQAIDGVINILTCLMHIEELISFLHQAERFTKVSIPLHRDGMRDNISFYSLMSWIGDSESLYVIVCSLLRIIECAPAADSWHKALVSAVMNVSHNLLMDGHISDLILRGRLVSRRMKALAVFLARIQQSPALAGNWEWELTGSDPHCQGSQAIMLRRPGGMVEKVFKPRSMVADFALFSPYAGASAMGLFAKINELLINAHMPLPTPFPTLEVQCLAMETGGLEQFAIRAPTLSRAQIATHYTLMGALLFFAKLFGITDLHQDNIMTTLAGPVIIDTECAFLPGVITARVLDICTLSGALNINDDAFGERPLVHFMASEAVSLADIITSYHAGFVLLQKAFNHPSIAAQLLEAYLLALRWRPTVRILPISTDFLAADLERYWWSPADREQIINLTLEALKPYAVPRVHDAREAIISAYEGGDLPIFQLQVRLGDRSPLLINGHEAGYSELYANQVSLKSDFFANLEWLCALTTDKLPEISPNLLKRIFSA